MHIHGHRFQVTEPTRVDSPEREVPREHGHVPVGATRDLEFIADNPATGRSIATSPITR